MATSSSVIRVLVGEDHPMMVQSITAALSADPHFEVVGSAADGEELVAKYEALRPHVVLTDQRMPKLSGIDACRAILEIDSNAKVLLLSDVDDPKVVSAAMSTGAVGFVLKRNMKPDQLGNAIKSAFRGGPTLDDTTARIVMQELRTPSWPQGTLTAREVEIITLVSEGHTNKEVSAVLILSEATVKTYLDRIYSKLGVSDRAAAVRRAIEAGLIV